MVNSFGEFDEALHTDDVSKIFSFKSNYSIAQNNSFYAIDGGC